MTCEKFAEMLDNYESLTDEEKALMSEHASQCETCRQELDFMLSMINAVRTLPEMKVPDDFLENLNKRIDAEIKPSKRRTIVGHIRYNWQKYSAAAACLVLAAVIGANYDTLIKNMNGGDDGVITTVTTVSSPAPDNVGADLPAPTAAPVDNVVPTDNANNRAEENSAQPNNRTGGTSGFRNTRGTGSTNENTARQNSVSDIMPAAPYTSPQITAPEQPEISEAPVEEPATNVPEPTDAGTETLTLPRGVYVEARGARSGEPIAGDAGEQDNPYEINAMSDTNGGYAVAAIEDIESGSGSSSASVDNGLGYELNQSNMIVVKGEDFATAFDIISRYASDSYSNYFMVTSSDINDMLAALDEAGVSYQDNITVDTNKITFRISIG